MTEGIRVSTLIGINEHGFFGSTREGWYPDQPDAFAEPLLTIPRVPILIDSGGPLSSKRPTGFLIMWTHARHPVSRR